MDASKTNVNGTLWLRQAVVQVPKRSRTYKAH